jgi:protoporphyrinogen IX oxidase
MSLYDLLRGLHIAAVIAWMAGFSILPRLFAIHASAPAATDFDADLQNQERAVLRLLINPAMVAAFLFGGGLIWLDGHDLRGWGFLLTPWMLSKIAGILLMTWHHHVLARARKRFARGERPKSVRYWRGIADAPLLLAGLMALAVTIEFGT